MRSPFLWARLALLGVNEENFTMDISTLLLTWAGLLAGPAAALAAYLLFKRAKESKARHAALPNIERRYLALYEQTHDGVFLIDLNLIYLSVNQQGAAMLGYTPEEIVGKSLMITVRPEEEPIIHQHYDELVKEGKRIPIYERNLVKKDGSLLPVEVNVDLVRDETGRPLYVQSMVRDMSEHKKMERQRTQAYRRLDAILAAVPDPLFEMDIDGNYRQVHTSRPDLMLNSPEWLVGSNVRDVLPPEVAELFLNGLQEAARTGQFRGGRYKLNPPRGETWFELNIARQDVAEGEKPVFTVMAHEMTNRVRAEEALQESERRYRSIIDRSSAAIYMAELDGRFSYANPFTEELTGYSQKELLGMHFADIVAPEWLEQVRAYYTGQLANEEPVSAFEFQATRKDGAQIWIAQTVTLLRDEGQITGFEGVARDVTLRKKAEQEMERERDAMEALAHTDALTGLLNRRGIELAAQSELDRAVQSGTPLSMLMMDGDRFKWINDDYGHPAGDEALRSMAANLQDIKRAGDWAGRLGGDEFLLVLPGAGPAEANAVARRLLDTLAKQPLRLPGGMPIPLSMSVGMACANCGEEETSVEDLIRRADEALYAAKQDKVRLVAAEG